MGIRLLNNYLGKRIDDIEKSVTDLMNDLGLSDDEADKP